MPPDERVVQQAIEGQRAELAEKTKLFLAELQKGMEGNAEVYWYVDRLENY